ncbi:hypothetical protein NLU13_3858 [Sarocladium strictum]|uniref:2EXR domain-containing protein n=1 Tax=Sarocladium strictum TaxID=5046 RepID=A0AA39GKC4_SARSR|nr:hypothetical protein NLU13_3858 [Sarocladium strictum]
MQDAEFYRFAELPAELRLLVWTLVPFPERVIGLVPYLKDAHGKPKDQRRPSGQNGRAPHFVQTMQPSHLGIFPPMHVNREARSVWLSRLARLDQEDHVIPRERREGDRLTAGPVTVRFQSPFINYETDIVAVFGAWQPPGLRDNLPHHLAGDPAPTDPFAGLDRSKIRRVGLSELPYGLESAIRALDIKRLPALEEFSVLTLGPDPFRQAGRGQGASNDSASPELEMAVGDLQRVSCDIHDLDVSTARSHPFFDAERLRHPAGLSPDIRPLSKYTVYIKALLWHALSANWTLELDSPELTELRWEFLEYVFDGPQGVECPLPEDLCASVGHGCDEMLRWQPGFDVSYKLVCARSWSATAKQARIVSSD